MSVFLRRMLLFWLPVVAALGMLEALFWRVGETWPTDLVTARQVQNPKAVYQRGLFSQNWMLYKLRRIQALRPQLLVIGSSRVMKLRSEMFAPGMSFYNAGGQVHHIDHLSKILDTFPPGYTPRVVIVGVDSWWFNPTWHDNIPAWKTDVLADKTFDWKSHLVACRSALLDRRLGLLLKPAVPDRIGLHAIATGEGFRLDGSLVQSATRLKSGKFASDPRKYKRFQVSSDARDEEFEARLATLRAFLARLKRSGTAVIGFAPPVSEGTLAAIRRSHPSEALWRRFRSAVPDLFTELDLSFVDASMPSSFGLDDSYLLDDIHAEETFHLYLLLKMLDDPRAHKALPSGTRDRVELLIKAPKTNRWYPDFDSIR